MKSYEKSEVIYQCETCGKEYLLLADVNKCETECKIKELQYKYEREKLYNYLGKPLVNTFKKHNVIVAGGSITSLFTNKEIADIDVYTKTEDDLIGLIEDLFSYWVISHTSKATLFKIKDKLIQVIHIRCFSDSQDIFNSFDFTPCMGAFDFATEEFVLHHDFLKHNSQRILEFNSGTSFPLMSALRVQKYEKKGYKISKSEFLKVVLACMNTQVESYEELKEHLGGMYGLNMDKVFDESKEFSLDDAIVQLSNLHLNDEYFKEPVRLEFDDIDDIIENIIKTPKSYFVIKSNKYLIRSTGSIRKVDSLPKGATNIDPKEYFGNKKIYKFVQKKDNKYFSFFDKAFEYILGQVAVAKNEQLFCGLFKGIDDFTYKNYNGAVLIELEIEDVNDITEIFDYDVRVKKAKFIREVPISEYSKG